MAIQRYHGRIYPKHQTRKVSKIQIARIISMAADRYCHGTRAAEMQNLGTSVQADALHDVETGRAVTGLNLESHKSHTPPPKQERTIITSRGA